MGKGVLAGIVIGIVLCAGSAAAALGGPRLFAAEEFTLYGDTATGWGFTSGGESIPGPTMTVDKDDVVTMNLYSEDGLPHRFHIDYDGDGVVDSGEPVSPFFTTFVQYTFTASTAGTFNYRCTVHPGTMYGSWVTNPPPSVHDVAVTSVAVDKTTVDRGETVMITVQVENQGTVTETTTVTAFAGASDVGSQSVTLGAGELQTQTFSWDTTSHSPGTYLVHAEASTVPGETDTADNTKDDGTVTVQEPPPPPPGILMARLSGRSAWPNRHHHDISRHGSMQALWGKIANAGPGPVTAKVLFEIYDASGALVGRVESGTATIPVGGDTTVSGSWSVTPGRVRVVATCLYDSNNDGTFDGAHPDTKTFSFAVVP